MSIIKESLFRSAISTTQNFTEEVQIVIRFLGQLVQSTPPPIPPGVKSLGARELGTIIPLFFLTIVVLGGATHKWQVYITDHIYLNGMLPECQDTTGLT